MSWADRIAYVCHDFEDAVYTGIVTANDLPVGVVQRCGSTRREQLATFIDGVVSASTASGHIGMDSDTAEALADFRSFDYERIYLRPASLKQAGRVIDLLRALVDHFVANPGDLPPSAVGVIGGGPERDDIAGSPLMIHAAVCYVGGMTDRFACRSGLNLLGWTPQQLPDGLGLD